MTQELIERLEPCPVPWCLGEADADWYAVGEQGRPYWVRCKVCGCKTPRQYATVADAIAAWNTRDQSQSARIAELRDGLEDAASCLKEAGHTISRLEHGKIGERNFAYVAAEHAASLTKDSTSG